MDPEAAVPVSTSRLEASCTYHVFPGEDVILDSTSILSTTGAVLWNPAKSTTSGPSDSDKQAGSGKRNSVRFDLGLNSSAFSKDRNSSVSSEKDARVKEFVNDNKPLKLSISSESGVKGSLKKPMANPDLLTSSFEVQGLSKDGLGGGHRKVEGKQPRGKLRQRAQSTQRPFH
jgi:hypothetical protein